MDKNNKEIKEDDIVLCTVKRIEGTTVFLKIENNGEGSMTFSEVSPGRIRNIRGFVVPNKKIVCKILRIRNGHIELSLRRVTGKEREEVMDRHKKENVLVNILKTALKEKTQIVLEKIKEKYDLADFLDDARENPNLIDQFVGKEESENLHKILKEKREKEKEIREKITLKSLEPLGLKDIQKTLKTDKAEIHYLGSSKFSVAVKAPDFKTANINMEKVLKEIKEKAKKLHITFETKRK